MRFLRYCIVHQTPVHTNGRHTGSITPFLNSNICISTDRSMLPSRNKPIQFTILVRANRAMTLGMTMRLLNISVSSHTRSLLIMVPIRMNTRAMRV